MFAFLPSRERGFTATALFSFSSLFPFLPCIELEKQTFLFHIAVFFFFPAKATSPRTKGGVFLFPLLPHVEYNSQICPSSRQRAHRSRFDAHFLCPPCCFKKLAATFSLLPFPYFSFSPFWSARSRKLPWRGSPPLAPRTQSGSYTSPPSTYPLHSVF